MSSINLEFSLQIRLHFFPVMFFLLSGYYLFTSSAALPQYWCSHPLPYFLRPLQQLAEAILKVGLCSSRRSRSCSRMLSLHYFELSASYRQACHFLQLYRLCSCYLRCSPTTCSSSRMPLTHRHSCLQLLLCRSLQTGPITFLLRKLQRHQ